MTRGKYWQHSFRADDEARQQAARQQPGSSGGSGRECARAHRCARATTAGDGTVTPGRAQDGPLCGKDRARAEEALGAMPLQYVHLVIEQRSLRSALALGARASGTVPDLAAKLAAIDAIMRGMEDILASWDERVACEMSLSRPYTSPGRRQRGGKLAADAARALLRHFGTLLALGPQTMSRPGIGGEGTEFRDLDGGDAAGEIISLHGRACRILGDFGQLADTLDGVPCKQCDDMALERAEPPSDPRVTEMFSVCASCRHQMSREDFEAWVSLYSKWADGRGLTCRRCLAGDCGQCDYHGCACTAGSHAAA